MGLRPMPWKYLMSQVSGNFWIDGFQICSESLSAEIKWEKNIV